MKLQIYFVLVLACILTKLNGISGIKLCSGAAPGGYVGRNQQCVALIQTKCPGVGETKNWRRGIHVRGNCRSIARNTAIATFEGPGGSYITPGNSRQHAAIFLSCDNNGITVLDQYSGSGGVRQRVLRYGGLGVNNGDLFLYNSIIS